MNLTSILALVAAFLTWVLIWRTRLGYEMRAFGHSEPAAVYAGIDPVADHHHRHADLRRAWPG